jgi:hypothetical protein
MSPSRSGVSSFSVAPEAASRFNRDSRPRIEANLKAVGPAVPVTRLQSRADIAAYLATLPIKATSS